MTATAPQIAGYRMLGLLGEGGMGSVFLAEDEVLQRRVAVKVIGQHLVGEGDARQRFLREARAMAVVENPHVVRVYAFGETGGQAYFVMELVEGETLGERLARLVQLPEAEARRLAGEVTDGLRAAWARGIVHRDVKPANILIDADGHVRVADFGLARRAAGDGDTTSSAAGLVAGTPHYMSPEQARGEEADFRSDIYSLGIVLYEMVGGRRPFTGRTPVEIISKHLSEPVPPLADACPTASADLAGLVARMTAKKPEERPKSYPDLLRELTGTPGPGVGLDSQTATMVRGPVPRQRWSRKWRAVAAAVVVLGVGGAAWARLAPPRRTGSFAVAVTPFYGPDADSAREGRLLSSLLENEIERRLPPDDVDMVGVERTGHPVRSRREAKALAEKLDVDVVVWGDALVFGNQLELAPRLTRRDGTLVEAEGSPLLMSDPASVSARRARAAAVGERVAAMYAAR